MLRSQVLVLVLFVAFVEQDLQCLDSRLDTLNLTHTVVLY